VHTLWSDPFVTILAQCAMHSYGKVLIFPRAVEEIYPIETFLPPVAFFTGAMCKC